MKILNVNFTITILGDKLSPHEIQNLKELQKLGHYVATVTTDKTKAITDMKKKYSNDKSVKFFENKPIQFFEIPVYVLRCPFPQFGYYCPNADELANELVKKFDVIHIRNWYHHIAIAFYKAAVKNGIPFVFTAHGTLDPVARKKYFKRIKYIIDKLYTKKMIEKASAIHSYGESETKEFLKLGADPKKIFRIDGGVNKKDFEIKKKIDIFEKFDINKNKPFMLFLGRIDKKKGIELLLEAFARLDRKNFNIIIAGPSTPESYRQKILELIKDLDLEKYVKLIGSVYDDDKVQILEASKFFVLTSYSDIHPMAAIEALTLGKPVLITENCDFPEVAEFDAGIVTKADIESIYSGLKKMMYNEDGLEKYSINAKQLATEKFCYEKQVYEFEKMYKFAIKNN